MRWGLLGLLVGAVILWALWPDPITRASAQRIVPGMSLAEVKAILGEPNGPPPKARTVHGRHWIAFDTTFRFRVITVVFDANDKVTHPAQFFGRDRPTMLDPLRPLWNRFRAWLGW
jgi:hypothetical protein